MKAWQVSASNGEAANLAPLAFPSLHRDGGWIDPMPYRQQASGELPLPRQNLARSSGLRTIRLSDGAHPALFAGGDTLNFVIAGRLHVGLGNAHEQTLEPGDLLLVRAAGADGLTLEAAGDCQLVQLGVAADWPGADAAEQDEGTPAPRRATPNLRRMDKQADDRTWFSAFGNLFPAERDRWSAATPVAGFRFLRFPDRAFIDWHPEVVNNLAIFLSGDMEIEIGGGANDGGPAPIDHFVAGDVLLAADRTGEGHIDRMHGVIHLALIVIEDQYLWPIENTLETEDD